MQNIDEPTAYEDVTLLIDGKWCEALGGERIPVINPGTEQQIGWVSLAREADLDAALAAAARGFAEWRQTAPLARAKVLAGAATLLRERADRIAQLLSLEQGKPLVEALGECLSGLEFIQAVRRERNWDSVQLVMVTTETEIEQVQRAMDAGANEYVMKPFTPEVLVAKLSLLGAFEE